MKVKPATPWNVTLAKLASMETRVVKSDGEALEARWMFGAELVRHRVDYKGRKGLPKDLLDLTIKQCKLSRAEINYRVQFAVRYPTKKLMSNAVGHYQSWHQMTREGLVEKKRERVKKPRSVRRIINTLMKALAEAFAHNAVLTRDEVKTLDQLYAQLAAILKQIDRNDQARAS